jgi:hypothetical protein
MNTRKWNKLYVGTTIVALAIGVTYACKDFLNTPAQGVLNEDALATKSGVEGLLIAAYRSLDCSSSSVGSWGCAASNWVWGSVPSGDAHKGSDLGDQAPIFEVETYLWSAGDMQDYLNQKWSQVYEGVFRANATLRLLNKVRQAGGIDSAEATGIRGEAIFLRAHYHFEAYRLWKNIPYYTEVDSVDFKKSNQGVDVIGNLVRDLDTAAALLAATPRNGEVGRATKWTARAYLGRVYAYAAATNPAYWDSALTTLRAVQASNVYHLETSFDHVWTGFVQFQNGPETIFAFQASVRDGEPSGWNSNWGERLNFPYAPSHFGCCGFHQPTFNLVNFFQVDANGLPLAVTDPNWDNPVRQPDSLIPTSDTGQVWKGLNFIGGNLTPVDPRLDWTVGRDNVPYKDWGLHNRSWIRDAAYSGPYSPKKNVQENAANAENNVGWQTTQTNDVNIHIYRYADLLLLLAEAEVESPNGSLANALAIVNQIRTRAGQVAQGCGKGSDATTDSVLKATYPACATDERMAVPMIQGGTVDSLREPWALYRIGLYPSFPSQAYARTAVWYERRLELAMEGQHFFDLRRWGSADTTIAHYLGVEKSRIPYLAGATYAARNALYPIPTLQIELSKVGTQDMLVQNPGW